MDSREGTEDDDGDGEGGEQHTGADDRDERLGIGTRQRQRSVHHEAEQREGGREPDQVDGGPGHPSLRRFMFCRLTDCLWR